MPCINPAVLARVSPSQVRAPLRRARNLAQARPNEDVANATRRDLRHRSGW